MKIFVLVSTLFFSVAALATSPRSLVGTQYKGKEVVYIGSKFTKGNSFKAVTLKTNGILRGGAYSYSAGVITLLCDKNGKDCEVDSFEPKKYFKKCDVTKAVTPICSGRVDQRGNTYSGPGASQGHNAPVFEEHDSRTSPGYNGGGNDSNSPAFDERAGHHLDQPRTGGNEIDGVTGEF